jgi:hypothetical protein
MKKGIIESFLMSLSAHNEYQSKKDAEKAREIAEALGKRFSKTEWMIREPTEGFSIQGMTHDRRMTAEEKADDARNRVRILKAPEPAKVETRPVLQFTKVWARGRWSSADIIVLELTDETAGTLENVQLEARRRSDIFESLASWCLDPFAKPIPGRSGRAFIDTGLSDDGARVFAELVGIDPESASGLLLGDLRAFKDDVLPESLPLNVDVQAYAHAELQAERKRWAEKNAPKDASDRQREREREALQASIDQGVAAALASLPRDALGRPIKLDASANPMAVSL